MRADLIETLKSVDLDLLGSRVKRARIRAGLPQARVAGTEMSTAYVSRIEAGQRRPDPRLLELMAGRLAVTVEELLTGVHPDRLAELRVALDYAELSLASGDATAALDGADTVLRSLTGDLLPDLRRQAVFTRARALEASGAGETAIEALEELVEHGPGDTLWLRAMTTLSRCYRESGDLVRAVEVGDRAAEYIDARELGGLADGVALTLTVAAAHFERGDVAHATRLCRQALRDAEERGTAETRAAAYWNASILESEAGNPDAALTLAGKALQIFEVAEDARNLARLRTQVGILQLRTDPPRPDEALEALTRAEKELRWSSASDVDRADNLLAQARAHFLRRDAQRSEKLVAHALETAGGHAPLIRADAYVLLGRLRAEGGATEDAKAAYRDAILELTSIGADRGAAQLWFELGGLLEAAGETADALDAYRRAAASTGLVTARTAAPFHS